MAGKKANSEDSTSISAKEEKVQEKVPKTRVVTELKPEQIRWCYKKHAADKQWHPLCGRESLAIESAYRRHQAVLAAERRREEAPCASAKEEYVVATPHWAATAVALDDLYEMVYDQAPPTNAETPAKNNGTNGTTDVTDVSVSEMEPKPTATKTLRFPYRLKPIYWEGSRLLLARGTWFLDAGSGNWQPLNGTSPDLARRVEAKHFITFGGQPIGPAVKMTFTGGERVACEVKDAEEERKPGHGAEVRWFSINDIYLYNHSHTSRLWRYLRLGTTGTRLARGYPVEATLEDGPPPITDLLFFIHGIGQKRTRSPIQKHVTKIREASDILRRLHFKDQPTRRPLFLPVDWRSELQLNERVIESLTPDYIENIRGFFNESLMDLMYYASPIHGRKISERLSQMMNRMYNTFIAHDPGFLARNGRVSLVAHSLGSVIAYDIISVDQGREDCQDNCVSIILRADAKLTKLHFPVHHMFCLGSPLGVFLAARHVNGMRILHPPSGAPGFRLFNIYHPADPVAYRIEPLISEIYATVRPLDIHKADARDPTPYHTFPNEMLIRRTLASKATPPSSKSPKDTAAQESQQTEKSSTSPSESTPKAPETPKAETPKVATTGVSTVTIPPADVLPYRVDYVLRPGYLINAIWAAITSHQSYWSNPDVAMFMLTTLYRVTKEEKEKSSEQKSS